MHRGLVNSWITTFAAVCVALTGMSGPATAAEHGWTVDFEAAKATAAKEHKDLLLDFTGSDWCSACMVLKLQVLSRASFISEAPKHFVLVTLDYPKDQSQQTKAEIQQNKKLEQTFHIGVFPTLILADARGRPYAKVDGYRGESAELWLQKALKLQEKRVARDKALAKADGADGVDKAKLLDEALDAMDPDFVLIGHQAEIKQIIALDGDNAAGLKAKYEGLLKLPELRDRLHAIYESARRTETQEVLKKLDAYIEDVKLIGPALQEGYMAKGSILLQIGRSAESRELLEKAIRAAPQSNTVMMIRDFIKDSFE